MAESNRHDSEVPSGGPTGPRTTEGKARTKSNATTHGIFSGVVVLRGESRNDYESLLNGLREVFQVQGTLEDLLVDKLAMIVWRHRRLIFAEQGQFRQNAELYRVKLENQQKEEAERILGSVGSPANRSLLENISNPSVLNRCLEMLVQLRNRIQDDTDPSPTSDEDGILRKIYGQSHDSDGQENLFGIYSKWTEADESEYIPEERHLSGYVALDISPAKVLKAVISEINRLTEFKKSHRLDELERSRGEVLRLSINDGGGLERLVRYESSLERAFDRTLAQLERIQRIRLGQVVPPRLEIGLNS